MYRTANCHRMMGLAVTTAMAGALLSGCATTAAPRADLSASRAEAALAAGNEKQAITAAEAAVLAEPNNAAYRATLANAYLQAGRFASAETTFDDAMALGDKTPRTALSLALAMLGQGKQAEAGQLLSQWEDRIPAADLGLAMALSGQAERGIYLMSNAIRAGQNDAKIRQNLAYAYALAGRWREARLMASQDVPADQVGSRMEQWAMSAQPEAWHTRVAGLLDVPAGVRDGGQPVRLALANTPSVEQLAAAAAPVPAPQPAGELPALASSSPSPEAAPQLAAPAVAQLAEASTPATAQPATFAAAFTAPAAIAAPAEPAVVQPAAARFAAPATVAASVPRQLARQDAASFTRAVEKVAPRRVAERPSSASSTHLIQLGSFATEAGARRAWSIYAKKYPELAGHQMVISEAVVRGKHYWRVSADGYDLASSSSMCSRVRSNGAGCLAWAEGRPLPGAIDTGIRLARR